MQTIYFRTRGGDRQGWGNVIRLLSIYNFFSKKFKCLFIYEGNENVRRYIDKLNINSLKLKTNIKVFEEKKVIDKLKKSDFSIMEMLNCNFLRQKIYKDKSKKLIVIDDILKKKYCSDIVICGQKKYTKFSNLNLKSGYKYFPLRDDFKKYFVRCRKHTFRKHILYHLWSNRLKKHLASRLETVIPFNTGRVPVQQV